MPILRVRSSDVEKARTKTDRSSFEESFSRREKQSWPPQAWSEETLAELGGGATGTADQPVPFQAMASDERGYVLGQETPRLQGSAVAQESCETALPSWMTCQREAEMRAYLSDWPPLISSWILATRFPDASSPTICHLGDSTERAICRRGVASVVQLSIQQDGLRHVHSLMDLAIPLLMSLPFAAQRRLSGP